MTKLQEQKERELLRKYGNDEKYINEFIEQYKENERQAKKQNRLIKKCALKNKLLAIIDKNCDYISGDESMFVYEYYGIRKNYEFKYDVEKDKITMNSLPVNDEWQCFGYEDKPITKMSQLAMINKKETK